MKYWKTTASKLIRVVNDLENKSFLIIVGTKSVLPVVEAFPPQFRMIAASNDPGANLGGENGSKYVYRML